MRARSERKSSNPPSRVTEVGLAARIAGLHEIREYVGVEQDDVEGMANQSLLCAGTVDFFDECADVFAGRDNAAEGLRIEWFRTALLGKFFDGLVVWGADRLTASRLATLASRGMCLCLQARTSASTIAVRTGWRTTKFCEFFRGLRHQQPNWCYRF
jgi:hypothetical protein